MCHCQTFSTESGRYKVLEALSELEDAEKIYAAVPFGISDRVQDPQKMIVRDEKYGRKMSAIRVNTNLHAKMIFYKINGECKVIHGSGNFTSNSIRNQHEIYHVTSRDCHRSKYAEMFSFFQTLWKRSTAVERDIEVEN